MKSGECASGEKRKAQQLVASTDTPNIGIKGSKSLKRRNSKFNHENIPANNSKHSPRSRQTVLSEYFTSPKSSPKETPVCKPNSEDNNDNGAVQKMVNIPLLLRQLLHARVVLNRVLPPKETNKQTITPVKPTVITKVNDSSRVVQRYCYRCKILEIDHLQITKRKLCQRCGTLLVYVCVKCNTSHFIQNKHMRKHFLKCEGNNGESVKDALDSVTLYYCANCSFMSSHEKTMTIHIKHKNHRLFDGEKVIEAARMGVDDQNLDDPQIPFIVKRDAESSRKGIKRYCPRCKKIVKGCRTKNNDHCVICNTRLLFKCGKCKFKCNFYKTLYYHVKVKCFPNVYRCPKCDYTAPLWHVMYSHLKTQKCSTLSNSKKINSKKSKET